ncbi:MAG: hypothetical protein Q8928_11740 [Bacteroidota bacterium]|nr:hypothetical protein [Bacteroidota bacterium]
MKKAISLKFFIVSISLLLVVGGIGWACADLFDADEVNYSLFSPEVIHNNDYRPFFRSFHALYQYDHTGECGGDFTQVNLKEWQEFFKNKVDTSDLSFLVYTANLKTLDTLIFYFKKPGFPISKSLKNNSLLTYPDKAVITEFLYYLGFAKRCEPYATYVDDLWGQGDKVNPRSQTTDISRLLQRGEKAYFSAKNDYIWQRYVFQLVRMYFYGGNFDGCIDFYHAHNKELLQNNSIKYRTMGYAAGALFHTKRYSEANYLYSLVYDNSPLLKVSAYLSFHPVEEADWQESLKMARSVRERNVLWHLLGIYADPLRAMQEIYKTEPSSELLDLLLVRAVNIEEEKFVARRYFEGGATNDSAVGFDKKNINPKLFEFIRSVADKGNTHKPCVWNLAAGYFYLAMSDYKKTDKYLDKALTCSKNDTLVAKQAKLLQVACHIERTTKPDRKFEEKIVAELNWLKDEKQPDLRNGNAYEWALKRLSEIYFHNKEYVKSECLDYLRDLTFYTDSVKASKMIALMDKPNKTEFEKFILTCHPYKRSDIIEYQAVQLVYKNKLEDAITRFNTNHVTGPAVPGDPFLIHINDCHDCDHANPPQPQYSKVAVLERMVSLRREAEGNSKVAAMSSFLLANAYYNLTYFGNTRAMYETSIIGFSSDYPYFDMYEFRPAKGLGVIFDCSLAEKYYRRAMELSKDQEFKAKCCFMAAKCEQNKFFLNKPKEFKDDFRSGQYFNMLKTNYSKTRYYKEIIRECGYFRTYLGMR